MSVKASVIIPNWNGLHHLDVCLSALRNQSFADFETIVVDNGSSDGSQSFVRECYPEAKLLELYENLGFTGACNAGLREASGEFIVLLNNDTEADENWLANLINTFGNHPGAGVVASKILLFDRRDYFHAAGDFYRVDGIPGNRGVWQQDRGQYDQLEEVFSACAAAAAYRRSMLETIGFLDDAFFFSCEDVDLGWRANLAGWKVLYQPAAIVYHKLKATGGSETGSYYDGRNFLYLIWKNYPRSLLRKYWRAIAKAQLDITWQAVRSWRGKAARARIRGQVAGLAGYFKMRRRYRKIQDLRTASDAEIESVFSPIESQYKKIVSER